MPVRRPAPQLASARARRCLVVFLLAWFALARAQAGALRFVRVADEAPGDPATSLAIDRQGGVAIGGTRGVRALDPTGRPQTWLRRGPVVDLAFLDEGSLLVATAGWVYRVGRDGRAVREHLAPGSDVPVRRLAAGYGSAVAATSSGVYLREGGARWRPVRRLPRRPASLVALREQPTGLELWSVIEGELWIAQLKPGEAVVVDTVVRSPLPSAHRSDPAVDVHFGIPFAEVVLVFPDSLATRDAAGTWRTLRPPLPPGARASRIEFAHGRLWLATDAGLLSARRLEGPWERALPPLGTAPIAALVGDGRAIFVAARGRVMKSTEARRAAAPMYAPPASEPAISEVQSAALDYVDLDPERLHALRRGAATRGWLPKLIVSGGYERGRGHKRDYDQSFVSGGMRELFDRESDDDDALDFDVTLSWDFGDTRFHPEEIDVLRETRAVISLRDDVLDEVTQIYFERGRVLAQLASLAELDPERAALAARAGELAAGLDAWTGGWFSRRAREAGPATPHTKE